MNMIADERNEAGFASRAVAIGIDAVIVAASVSLSAFALSSISSLIHLSLEPRRDTWAAIVVSVGGVVFVILYNMVGWSLVGRTPGKAIMGLRVESSTGGRVTPLKAIFRMAGYLLSTVALGAGFLWVLFDKERRALHDHVAGTRVVYAHEVRNSKRIGELLARTSRTVTIRQTHVEASPED